MDLLSVFSREFKGLIKLDSVKIDNNIFRLHHKATVLILVCSSLLTTLHTYFGDPIDCVVDGVPNYIMDTYCWIHSTFSIPSRWAGKPGKSTASCLTKNPI